MFLSAVIPLTALDAGAADSAHFLGREAHALFLDLARGADPALADSLHAARGDKPFTVSALLDPHARRGAATAVRAGAQYEWRVTAFEPRLAQLLAESVLPNLPREVRLGSAHFATGAPITDRAAHPWAGVVDASALVDQWFGSGSKSEKRITLEFASPTAHRQIHRNVLFPQPAPLWGGWLRAWNAYAQPAFEDDLIARVEADVAISRYALRTQVVDFGEFREAGYVGECGFTIFSAETALRRVLHLLADFAFFCGTGYKTTQGMGMTRKVLT